MRQSTSITGFVRWLVCWVTHSFDDPHVAPYWPTWPCFSRFNDKSGVWTRAHLVEEKTSRRCFVCFVSEKKEKRKFKQTWLKVCCFLLSLGTIVETVWRPRCSFSLVLSRVWGRCGSDDSKATAAGPFCLRLGGRDGCQSVWFWVSEEIQLSTNNSLFLSLLVPLYFAWCI